jgi:signal transduction histidine kinase
VLAYLNRHVPTPALRSWDFPDVFASVLDLAVPLVGLILAYKRPENRIGWLFLAGGLVLGLSGSLREYGVHSLVAGSGSLPAGREAAWLGNWIWPAIYAVLAFVFLLFPTGQLLSGRWRPAMWLVGGAFTLAIVELLVKATSDWQTPFILSRQGGNHAGLPAAILIVLLVAGLLISVAAVVARFASSSGEERLQLKWFAAAAVLVVVMLIATGVTQSAAVSVVKSLAIVSLWLAIAVAVLKYHLYDVDIVISKALLYGSLAVFITAIYAGLVVGVGTLVGNRRSPLLAALAAAVVAVAFQPVRQSARSLANRVVYGKRSTPYQVLSDFARRIGGTYASEEVLPRMARIVAAGTGAQRVVVWLRMDNELRADASSDAALDTAAVITIEGDTLPPMPDADLSVPVLNDGRLLGAISLRMPKDEPLRPEGRQLVSDVASQAGLVLANAGLIEDLRASRQRLVAAQDEERRRLERNIHDGAQQDLVALAIKISLGATADDLAQAREIFGELRGDVAGTLENLRDLARGIYPPLLADMGLAAALNAQASKSAVPVAVEADGLGRFSEDTEAAVYFCCLEALQNTAKYGNATQARICIRAQNGALQFTVTDNGIGFDTRKITLGSGLRNMTDRLAALGGRLEVQSAAHDGTTITGHLPIAASPAAIP